MDYQKIYNEIIERSKLRGLNKKILDGYYEKHHIIPRCISGSNDKSNLVLLTAREHYLCHWLLWKIHKNNVSLFMAYHKMVYQKRTYQERNFKISSKQYEILKLNSAKRMSEFSKANLGNKNPFYGKSHTDEIKKRISYCMSNRHITNSWKLNHSNMMKGENNPRALKCKVDDMIFNTTKSAAEYIKQKYGFSLNKSRRMINNNLNGWCLI